MSQCPMKDEIAKSDWAIKKGPQPVQDMNDNANEDKSEKNKQVESQSTNGEKETSKKTLDRSADGSTAIAGIPDRF